MQRKLVTRSRLAAATVLSLGAIVGGSAVIPAPAQAGDCVTLWVWHYKSGDSTRYTEYGPACVAPTPWKTSVTVERGTGVDGLPPGSMNGVGYRISVPLP